MSAPPAKRARTERQSTLLRLDDDVLRKILLFVMWDRYPQDGAAFGWRIASARFLLRQLAGPRQTCRRIAQVIEDPLCGVWPGAALAHLRAAAANFSEGWRAELLDHYVGHRSSRSRKGCKPGMLCHERRVPTIALDVALVALSSCRNPLRFLHLHEDMCAAIDA